MTLSPPRPLPFLAFGVACMSWVVLSVRRIQRGNRRFG